MIHLAPQVIKLGKDTYRVYDEMYAISWLFYIKNGQPILKRIDAPKSFWTLSKEYQIVFKDEAMGYMNGYLKSNALAWQKQGELLGALA